MVRKTNQNITWQLVLDSYFSFKTLRPTSRYTYERYVRIFSRLFNEDFTNINMLDKNKVSSFRIFFLTERNCKIVTWNSYCRHFKALISFAIKYDMVSYKNNPFSEMLIKPGKKAKKTITESDIDFCINYLKDKQCDEKLKDYYYPCQFWLTLINVLRFTGIRRNQLLHIRIKDINYARKTLFLREEGSKNYYERELPLIDDVFDDVVELKNQLMKMGKKPIMQLFNIYHFKNNRSDNYKEMDFNRISSFFQKLSVDLSIRITPHRFRHTLATNLMKNPERNLTLVKELLGHASVTTTMEYIESDVEHLRKCLKEHFN